MQKILIINSKGGCGKTTLATNLAAYYAKSGLSVALMDHDPQGSSTRWLCERPSSRYAIHGIDATRRMRNNVTSSFALRTPPDTDILIMDAPAGVAEHKLIELIRQVDTILIPVLPSPIDIHAATRFIEELLLVGKVRQLGIRVGVVANRVREGTRIYKALERFLTTLRLPIVGTLRDTQNYIYAATLGMGIHEIQDRPTASVDVAQWTPVVNWINSAARGLPVSIAQAANH